MTDLTTRVDELRWDPPGPGTWTLDKVHVARPATAHFQEMGAPIGRGFTACARDYGWLISSFDIRFVNGFMYSQPALAPLEEFPERVAAAERAFATRRWRGELDWWDTEVKPAALAAHASLLAIDPDRLDDAALAGHVTACRDHHEAMWEQHHRFNGTHLIPVGDFLVSAAEWTGLAPARIALLLRGAAPVSRGWCPEAAAVVAALEDRPGARALIEDASDGTALLDALRDLGDDVAAPLDAWVAITGTRLIDGFDITNPTGLEQPNVLMSCLRSVLRRSTEPAVPDDEVAAVRALVPAEHRSDFDDRLAEARHCYRIRDERGIYSDAMAAGICRRAWLAAGRRLVDHGRLPVAVLAIQATAAELNHLLDGPDEALVRDLERRAARHAEITVDVAPPFLGGAAQERPALDALPAPLARMMRAVMGVNQQLDPEPPAAGDREGKQVLRGVGVSSGVHRGTARIVTSPDDFHRLHEGDVLVTITTGESFNVAISVVGAVVTDQGNVMCHAAITSREYGIPAVVGTERATATIPDGALVEVDGVSGEVAWRVP